MKKLTIPLFFAVLFLTGCGVPDGIEAPGNSTEADQCLRRRIFMECLGALPAGPQETKYNDWDEVVKACESAAYYQSLRPKSLIEKGCSFR